jgi:hypothetical protein
MAMLMVVLLNDGADNGDDLFVVAVAALNEGCCLKDSRKSVSDFVDDSNYFALVYVFMKSL